MPGGGLVGLYFCGLRGCSSRFLTAYYPTSHCIALWFIGFVGARSNFRVNSIPGLKGYLDSYSNILYTEIVESSKKFYHDREEKRDE